MVVFIKIFKYHKLVFATEFTTSNNLKFHLKNDIGSLSGKPFRC